VSAKHTPGPWRIVIDGTYSEAWPFVLGPQHDDDCSEAVAELPTSHVVKSRRGAPGCYSEKPGRFKTTPQHDDVMANARLIAAAPELLEALKAARDDLRVAGFNSTVSMLDEAIAKATGSAP